MNLIRGVVLRGVLDPFLHWEDCRRVYDLGDVSCGLVFFFAGVGPSSRSGHVLLDLLEMGRFVVFEPVAHEFGANGFECFLFFFVGLGCVIFEEELSLVKNVRLAEAFAEMLHRRARVDRSRSTLRAWERRIRLPLPGGGLFRPRL